jgi:hypothetical protein
MDDFIGASPKVIEDIIEGSRVEWIASPPPKFYVRKLAGF